MHVNVSPVHVFVIVHFKVKKKTIGDGLPPCTKTLACYKTQFNKILILFRLSSSWSPWFTCRISSILIRQRIQISEVPIDSSAQLCQSRAVRLAVDDLFVTRIEILTVHAWIRSLARPALVPGGACVNRCESVLFSARRRCAHVCAPIIVCLHFLVRAQVCAFARTMWPRWKSAISRSECCSPPYCGRLRYIEMIEPVSSLMRRRWCRRAVQKSFLSLCILCTILPGIADIVVIAFCVRVNARGWMSRLIHSIGVAVFQVVLA